jgi:hypothetical protein
MPIHHTPTNTPAEDLSDAHTMLMNALAEIVGELRELRDECERVPKCMEARKYMVQALDRLEHARAELVKA